MMCLKYPKPEVMTEVMPGGSVFFLPPQGKPGVADLAQPHLQRLRSQVERRLGTLHRVVCQPQRVGQSSSVAVTAEGACGEVHLLLTVGGHESWPSEEEYRHPRW
ncbi:TPA: acetyltransferase, partial [Escherichia coli]